MSVGEQDPDGNAQDEKRQVGDRQIARSDLDQDERGAQGEDVRGQQAAPQHAGAKLAGPAGRPHVLGRGRKRELGDCCHRAASVGLERHRRCRLSTRSRRHLSGEERLVGLRAAAAGRRKKG
jgi:hypothetical protein